MNVLSLCSGYGGIELGLRLADLRHRVVCYVERSMAAVEVLRARMRDGHLDDAPIWDDITTFSAAEWCGTVDLVTAGAPCQPFSTASRGRKVAKDLMPHVFRIASECGASTVFAENVRGAFDGLDPDGWSVASRIEASASALGAPHNRPRHWLLAYADREGQRSGSLDGKVAGLRRIAAYVPWANEPASSVLGTHDGVARGLDGPRRRLCGNGVVPAVAARAFVELVERASN